MTTAVTKILNSLFERLTDRQKEVLEGRFALGKRKEIDTLAAIGDRMGVTRERIRQIEKAAMDIIGKEIESDAVCSKIINLSKKYIKSAGGVERKENLVAYLENNFKGIDENNLALLVESSGAFDFYGEDENFWPFYYIGKNEVKSASNFINGWVDYLNEHKVNILDGSYEEQLRKFAQGEGIGKSLADNYLSITKKIHVNPYGRKGLSDWPEIKPKTTRDRIYLVLRKKREPLHFEAIASAINEVNFGAQLALAPTVHNELIKDPRFVLVGRGVYALREQGYEPGTAKEVIRNILKNNGPLKASDVVRHVKKQRLFKPNTVLINLQNKDSFERLPDGTYRIRES